MQALTTLRNYLVQLPTGKAVLWCYLIWYLCTVALHFDPSPAIWLNAAGISVIIGIALKLSVSGAQGGDRWQTLRLFLMPFCVSSFSQLIKGKGFVLIAPSDPFELGISVAACLVFVLVVFAVKRLATVGWAARRRSGV
ncbi:MAG: hypothetical protein JO006_17040 [Paucibacter sp.]|nr:hypothetical protein [Roseateles sp.]